MCRDHERPLYPYRVVCYASMERAAAQAAYDALHDKEPYHDGTFTSWSKHRSREHPYHFLDGVTFGVAETDQAPHDKFTTQVDASPMAPQQQDGGATDGSAP